MGRPRARTRCKGAGGGRKVYNQVYRPWKDHKDRGAVKGGVIPYLAGKANGAVKPDRRWTMIEINPQDTALLITDPQNDFLSPEGRFLVRLHCNRKRNVIMTKITSGW